MLIIGECLTRDEFSDYIKDKNFGTRPANRLVLHHTWKPTRNSWKGKETILGLKRYYEGKGWSTGPHLFIADDGIWLFTDMRKNGTHAGPRGNVRSIGIEVVGNYDNELWKGETKKNTLHVIKALQEKLKIDNEQVYFHRDFSTKTCPGRMIKKPWLFDELSKYSLTEKPMPEEIKPPSGWAKARWDWAVKNGIVTINSDPHASVPKEEVVVMLHNMIESITK